MKRVIIRSVRNDRIIKIWQIEIRISASAKKPKLFISGRTQNPTEKNQTEEEKMMRLIKKQSVGKNIRRKNSSWVYILAFLFPVMIFAAGFAMKGVYPFGENSALVVDGVHQYTAFYKELLSQLEKGAGWTYSTHSMGYDFYGLFCYYLSSPFSLLVLLFMKFMYVNDAVTAVILIKVGLCSVSMAWHSGKKYPGRGSMAVSLGCMYALSNFLMGYYSNVMWLDCIMLLPVLAYFIEQLVYTGKWYGYCLVLGCCILTSYYMGFMLCTFSALYYLANLAIIKSDQRPEKILHSLLKFAGSSIASACLAGITLIPGIVAVSRTAAAEEAGTGLAGVYGDIWKQLGALMEDSLSFVKSSEQGDVNLYCGCAVLLFAGMYFLNKEIRTVEKIMTGALVIFYFAGFHITALNLLLHGMHKPVGIPNRFAFILIFLLLRMSCDAWGKTEKVSEKRLFAGFAAVEIFCMVVGIKSGKAGEVLLTEGILAGMFLTVWTGNYFCGKLSRHPFGCVEIRKICGGVLAVLILAETGIHGIVSITDNGTANRDIYVESEQEIGGLLESAGVDQVDYRTAIVNPLVRNEEILYQLNGMSMYSSTNTEEMWNFVKNMGFENLENRFQYAGSTEVMDMLLGIRYLFCRNTRTLHTAYKKIAESQSFDLYENPRALRSGYMVSDSVLDYAMEGTDPLEVQNRLLSGIVGKRLYKMQTVNSDTALIGNTTFNIHLKKGEHGYLYIPGTEPDTVTINGQEQKSDYWNNNFLDLGTYNVDTIVQVTTGTGMHEAVLGTYQESELDSIYEELSSQQMDLKDGKGSISVKKDGILMLSVFYDPDMKVYVDGKKADVKSIQGLTGVKLSQGTHIITMKYQTPGLKTGAVLSILMVGILGAICFARKFRNR